MGQCSVGLFVLRFGRNAGCFEINNMLVARHRYWVTVAIATALAATAAVAQHGRQTFAPHERNNSDAPAPIMWSTPELPRAVVDIESAEERYLRVEIVVRHLGVSDTRSIFPGYDVRPARFPGLLG